MQNDKVQKREKKTSKMTLFKVISNYFESGKKVKEICVRKR